MDLPQSPLTNEKIDIPAPGSPETNRDQLPRIHCPPMHFVKSDFEQGHMTNPDEGPSSASTWTSIGGVTINHGPALFTPADEVSEDGRVLRWVTAAELGHKGSLYIIIQPVRIPTFFSIQPARIILVPVWAKIVR